MNRLVRWVRAALLVLSVLLFVGLGLSWWLSYTVAQRFHVWHEQRLFRVAASADTGRISINWHRESHWEYDRWRGFSAESWLFRPVFYPPQHQFLLLGWERDRHSKSGSDDRTIVIPHGYLMLFAAIAPATAWMKKARRRRRVRRGLCIDCGYDLRATPDRCPECGLAPAPPPPRLRDRWRGLRPGRRRALAACAGLLVAAGCFGWHAWLFPLISIRARATVEADRKSVYFHRVPNAASVRYVSKLPGQWTLSLPRLEESDAPPPGIFRDARLQNIERLFLESDKYARAAWLREIADPRTSLANLRMVSFRWAWSVDDLRELARPDTGLKNLSTIWFGDMWGLGKEHFEAIAGPGTGLKRLDKLVIGDASLDASDLRELARSDSGIRLKYLILVFVRMDDAALDELARPGSGLAGLEELDISVKRTTEESKLSAAGLARLARPDTGLKRLRLLDISSCNYGDALLKEFTRPDSGLGGIETLRLDGTGVTAAGLKDLARADCGLKRLRELSLRFHEFDVAAIRELSRPGTPLAGLRRLNLNSTQIGDECLRELGRPDGGLKSLARLHLCYGHLTDKGLAHLARPGSLPALEEIDISSNMDLTPAGIAALQSARPTLKIIHDSKDY